MLVSDNKRSPATELMTAMMACTASQDRPRLDKIGQTERGVESSLLEIPSPPCVDAQRRRLELHILSYRDTRDKAGPSVRRELGRVLGRVQLEQMRKPMVVFSRKPYQRL